MPNENTNHSAVSVTNMEPDTRNASMGPETIARLDSSCRLHIHSKRYRLADPDGISAKAAIDGLVHAGVFANDSTKEIAEVTYSQEKIPKNETEQTIITIEVL